MKENDDFKPKVFDPGDDTPFGFQPYRELKVAVSADAKQEARVPYRMDLIPPFAALEVGATMMLGKEKHGDDTWRSVPIEEHVSRCIGHLYLWLSGNQSDAHLSNAACRSMMALELAIVESQAKGDDGGE